MASSLVNGAVIAQQAYAHIQDSKALVYIAVLTCVATYIDDVSQAQADSVRTFPEKFIKGEAQADAELEFTATILRDVGSVYPPAQAAMFTASMFDFVIGSVLEDEYKAIEVVKDAQSYPYFLRSMTGAPLAYAILIFPPNVPVTRYIQAIPDMMVMINAAKYVNQATHYDVLSFYKEELSNDTSNYISRRAAAHGVSKISAFRDICDETIHANSQALNVLASEKQAYEAYKSFKEGYMYFHVASGRYRLHELMP
ncbi:terpenoid synthase [Coniophora puteana RWD-64-598 SS2]|uniref:Terpenoid synthase n=1 Tax=Coniophora puteana (strain RWD-64-598) TaxID=741705 RepID=A0A5M3M7M3_CONPW|nr:terpenoid synthase [Coniophora puteana RWD-64-598 SS2]EIW74844.1 terpenoid synthase [Coniophora puteana RWD-64-598 SS2]